MTDVLDHLAQALQGRYAIQRELGHGGMATVYLATDLRHDRPVALKALRPQLAAALGPDRFVNEIRTTARLTHPHILPLLESGEAAGTLFYVMPFVDGETLRERLNREHRLPVEDALQICRDVADALDYAHGRGVIHRDIKPENVLLAAGYAVVADFGIARAIDAAGGDRLTETGVAVGTPIYMSPEQAAGDRELDGRSDLYSLGCVLYEMLAGEPPFTGPTVESILTRKLVGPPPPLSGIPERLPPWIEAVVQRALARAPADRFATAGEFRSALAGAARGPGRLARPANRRRVFVAAATIVAVVALGWWTAAHRRTGRPGGAGEAASVAVLDFANRSPDGNDAYLAVGLPEAITQRLVLTRRIRVKARGTVSHQQGVFPDDPVALGSALGVRYLVDGTLRRSRARLRVDVRLMEAGSGFQVWGGEYTFSEADLLAIEDSITRHVVVGVAGHLLGSDEAVTRHPTDVPEAYAHFLRGNYHLALRTQRGAERAVREYLAALKLDPGFGAARARIAYTYGLALDWGWRLGDLSERGTLLARGLELADSALALDSLSSDAWLALANLRRYENDRDWRPVVRGLERATALDPGNAEAFHRYGEVLRRIGQDSLARRALDSALALDPDRPITLSTLAEIAWRSGHYHEAVAWYDSVLTLNPSLPFFPYRALVRLGVGDLPGARADAERGSPSRGLRDENCCVEAEAALAAVELRTGDSAQARARLRRARSHLDTVPPLPDAALAVAIALIAAGDRDGAVTVLGKSVGRGAFLYYYLQFPELAPLRDHPGFQRLANEHRPWGWR